MRYNKRLQPTTTSWALPNSIAFWRRDPVALRCRSAISIEAEARSVVQCSIYVRDGTIRRTAPKFESLVGISMTADDLISQPENLPPHVVLLGAGASLAAFPDGDAAGRQLPLMNNLVEVVGLQPFLENAGLDSVHTDNFELLYTQLLLAPDQTNLASSIERQIEEYFSSLSLPPQVTIYDQLLLSLRRKDVIFTFNWDPLLFDAHARNSDAGFDLPEIFFLHGNVRIGACTTHDCWGARGLQCEICGTLLTPIPLLYPIEDKDYAKEPFIRKSWDAAFKFFRDAFTLTIFGYGAPVSDSAAVDLLHTAWIAASDRTREHIEIIDVADDSVLYDRWGKFAPTHHYHMVNSFSESRIANWPRRTCESLYYPMNHGTPCERFPIPVIDDLDTLQSHVTGLAEAESQLTES